MVTAALGEWFEPWQPHPIHRDARMPLADSARIALIGCLSYGTARPYITTRR
jgi:hypothetical protein